MKADRKSGERFVATASLLRAFFGIIALLIAGPALACSCAPRDFRASATLIFEGTVLGVTNATKNSNQIQKARIRVERVSKGRATGSVVVETQAQSSACGYPFKTGQRGEFLVRRNNAQYSTDLCLMRSAGRR